MHHEYTKRDREFRKEGSTEMKDKVWIDGNPTRLNVIFYNRPELMHALVDKYSHYGDRAVSVGSHQTVLGEETVVSLKVEAIKHVPNPRKIHEHTLQETAKKQWTAAKDELLEELVGIIEKHGVKMQPRSAGQEAAR